jgi:hypothetical protein
MSDSELDIFNIETVLIESNSMDAFQKSIDELTELFPMSEEMVDMVKFIMYKQYYTGRIDSNTYLLSRMKEFVGSCKDFTDGHAEVVAYVLKLSNDQLS